MLHRASFEASTFSVLRICSSPSQKQKILWKNRRTWPPDAFLMRFRRSRGTKGAGLQRCSLSRRASNRPAAVSVTAVPGTCPRLSTSQFEAFYKRCGWPGSAIHPLIRPLAANPRLPTGARAGTKGTSGTPWVDLMERVSEDTRPTLGAVDRPEELKRELQPQTCLHRFQQNIQTKAAGVPALRLFSSSAASGFPPIHLRLFPFPPHTFGEPSPFSRRENRQNRKPPK